MKKNDMTYAKNTVDAAAKMPGPPKKCQSPVVLGGTYGVQFARSTKPQRANMNKKTTISLITTIIEITHDA